MNQPDPLIEPLNARELKILSMIDEGLSYGEIAQALFIEKATVTWYVQQIYDKLNLEKSQRNHQKALARARELGFLGNKVTAEGEKLKLSHKNPYKGLRAFQQGDAGEFFGREALIQQLLVRLGEMAPLGRFLAVVGPSGSGKSSVLHAGLIPALQQGGVEGSDRWVITSMVPGSHPLDELEAALARVSAKPDFDIMAQLIRDERGLQRVSGMLLPENTELLLVVDQFEEIFSQVVDEDQSNHFLVLLSSSVTQPHSRVRVVLALRADYYDRPLMSPVISELFRRRTEVVTPLSAEELAQAILMPARQAGVQVEAGLVAAMVEEVSERPGLLPLMQYSLTELFDRRQDSTMTLAVYHQIGGIRGALTRQADILYESLSAARQALVRQLFLRLVKLGAQGEVLRRRVSRAELQTLGNGSQEVDELIDQLVSYRLITLDYDQTTGSAMVEIAHEALIREWGQLRDWLEDSREDIRQQRLLVAAASDWREANKDPSYLLAGTHLIQFQSWAQGSQVELGPVESEFLSTSIHEKQRHDRRARIVRNLVFGAVVLVAIVMSSLAVFALDRARTAQDESTRAERRTLENRSIQLAMNAQAAYAQGRTDLALLLAKKAVEMSDPPALSDQIFRTVALGPGIRAIYLTPLNPVTTIAISPDNQMVVAGGCGVIVGSSCFRGALLQFNKESSAAGTGQYREFTGLDTLELTGIVNDAEFNPTGLGGGQYSVLTACEGGGIILWNVSPNSSRTVANRYEGHSGAANAVAFSPDGKQFLAAYDQGTIILWDTATGKEIQRMEGGIAAVTSVTFSRDGQWALSASKDGTTILWDVQKKLEVRRYASPAGVWLTHVEFGPVNEYSQATVWGLSSDNSISIWELDTAREISGFPPASNAYRDIAFTREGDTAAIATKGMILLEYIQQENSEQRLMQISDANNTSVTALAISSDDTLLVSGDEEGNLELWNLPVRADLEFNQINNVATLGNAVLFKDSLHLLASTGSSDAITTTLLKVDLVNSDTEEIYPQLPGPVAPHAIAIDPGNQYIVVGGGNPHAEDLDSIDTPFLWVIDAESGEILHKLEGHLHNVTAVAISPDGRYAMSGSTYRNQFSSYYLKTGELFLWDLRTGQPVMKYPYNYGIEDIAISHDGKLAVTCAQGDAYPLVIVWEIATGKEIQNYRYGCTGIVFSADDQSILFNAIAESFMNKIIQFDINDAEIERIFAGLDGPTSNINISPDDRYLFAASPTTAYLWDIKTGQELSHFTLPIPGANSWAVFPFSGENAIIVQDNSNQLIRWHIDKLPSLADLQIWIIDNRYLRPFTCDERRLYEIQPYCED